MWNSYHLDRLGQLVWRELSGVPWEKLSEDERSTYRRVGEKLFGLGLDCAKAVCAQRAENERVYTPGVKGAYAATPYERAMEDIEAFRKDGELQAIGGAYAGAGRVILNPLNEDRLDLVER
jgi:hypothetical protein